MSSPKTSSFNLGVIIYNPTQFGGNLLFNVLDMLADFEADLIRTKTREGMVVAIANGRLRGNEPKFSKAQEAHVVGLEQDGVQATTEIPELVWPTG